MIYVLLPRASRTACASSWGMSFAVAEVFLALRAVRSDVCFLDETSWGEENSASMPSDISPDGPFPPIYCIALFAGNITSAMARMKSLRAQEPAAGIVAFGAAAGIFYQQILKQGLADIVVLSDPEFVLPILLAQDAVLEQSPVAPNLAYLHKNEFFLTEKMENVELDSLPFVGPYFVRGKWTVVRTSKNCPFHCIFCDQTVGVCGTFRQRTVTHVLAEIDLLVREYAVSKVNFADANFITDAARTRCLCMGLKKHAHFLHWLCHTRVDTVNPALLRLMALSGCRRIDFGVESGSSAVLKHLGKQYTSQDICNAVYWAKKSGLEVGIYLTVGNPQETAADLRETRYLIDRLGPFVEVTINPLLLLPGSRMYAKMLQSGKINEDDFLKKEDTLLYEPDTSLWRKEFAGLEQYFETEIA